MKNTILSVCEKIVFLPYKWLLGCYVFFSLLFTIVESHVNAISIEWQAIVGIGSYLSMLFAYMYWPVALTISLAEKDHVKLALTRPAWVLLGCVFGFLLGWIPTPPVALVEAFSEDVAKALVSLFILAFCAGLGFIWQCSKMLASRMDEKFIAGFWEWNAFMMLLFWPISAYYIQRQVRKANLNTAS